MYAYDKALSRAAGYTLLSRVFGAALSASHYDELADVPGLSASLPAAFDADEAAVTYQTLFGFHVFPFEGVFVDEEALLGGPAAEQARRHYGRMGYAEGLQTDQPDHLSTELGFLGYLSHLAAQAHAAGAATDVALFEEAAARFLDDHLLRWLPPLAEALSRCEAPFYAAAARLSLDLAHDHRRALPPSSAEPPALPAPPEVLDNPRAGVHDIARYLTRPVWCGLFLSRAAIQQLGRTDALPTGFGDRALLLANLFRSGTTFERLEPLLDRLHALLDHASTFHAEYRQAAAPADDPWQVRLNRTKGVLDRIAAALDEKAVPGAL